MTEQSDMLRAVLWEPEDDTVRLVYADWLDDQPTTKPCPICCGPGFNRGPFGNGCTLCRGESVIPAYTAERAEFIRLQIKSWNTWIAEHRPGRYSEVIHCSGIFEKMYGRPIEYEEAYHSTCGCDWCSMRQREWTLIDSYASSWYPPRNNAITVGIEKGDYGSAVWRGTILAGPNRPSFRCKFRRGFVEEITLPTNTFCGDVCSNCDGRGEERVTDAAGDADDMPCEACGGNLRGGYNRGSGRVGGLARPLFEAHPIRKVALSDKSPVAVTAGYLWFNSAYSANPEAIPPVLFRKLVGWVFGDHYWERGYRDKPIAGYNDHRGAALSGLSDAGVRYGRDLAGLPNGV